MDLFINKHLFASYCGLISSGYSLTDLSDSDIKILYNKIQKLSLDIDSLNYFSFAKTNMIDVNPYYPRASDMAAACFFLENDISEYIDFLNFCNSPSVNDKEFLKWIASLNTHIKIIESNKEFDSIFSAYERLVTDRFTDIDKQLNNFESIIQSFSNYNIKFVFAPNLLQSKYLTDFVFKDDKLYIISTSFSAISATHEYFHILLKDKQELLKKLIKHININDFIDTNAMLKLGYMNNNSEDNKLNAMEDCIIRALCGFIIEPENVEKYFKMNTECGFIGALKMFRKVRDVNLNTLNIDKIICKMFECTSNMI